MSLSVSIRHRLGDFELDTAFESQGRLTALFGPSGSGKTSVVNAIGGLIRPRGARIVADGRVLVDTDERLFLPAHRRRIGYVFQDARLLPHLTVSQNLRYGRFFTPKAERYADMATIVELLGIGHLMERKPGQLSGGEKQRVAIGRALVASPRLILMDEPLASLDQARRAEILPYLERLRDETRVPIVYVSHSVAEVARLATDIIVMAEGKVRAAGPAERVLHHLDVPSLEGQRADIVSVLRLAIAGHDQPAGLTRLRTEDGGEWIVPHFSGAAGDGVRLIVRARDVMIATKRPEGLSALNIVPCRIAGIEALDQGEMLATLDAEGQRLAARVTRHSADRLSLRPGMEVFAVVKAVSVEHG